MKLIKRIINKLMVLGFFNFLSDKHYIKLRFRLKMNKRLNLENPRTYNEKLQWLKLNDRKDEYTQMVDKYAVREYISKKIGEEYLIPLLGVWDSVDDIDFESLPNEFVLKCNHDSGGLVICKDKSKLDINEAKKKLSKAMKRDFYKFSREWPYKNVKRKIIAEKFMVDESGTELKDYKFFCFDGAVEYMFIATDRPHDTKFDFYDMEYNHLPFKQGHPNAARDIQKPKAFDEMKKLAQELSKGIKQVRIDFYEINGKVYFGEITFFHYSGLTPFEPEEWDGKFGELINIKKDF